MRHLAHGKEYVTVEFVPSENRARFTNLMRCGSAWVCPWCSWWIAEKRRKEMTMALAHLSHYAIPFMTTYTIRHRLGSPLERVLSGLLGAYRLMVGSRPWRNLCEEFGVFGSIKALEITHGLNGWHPHLHVVSFIDLTTFISYGGILHDDGGMDVLDDSNVWVADFERHVDGHHWRANLAQFAETALTGVGVKCTGDQKDLAGYVSKYGREQDDHWRIEHEATKAQLKQSRGDGKTPFALLNESLAGNEQSGRLFQEYAACTAGKAQLIWSPGLKELSGVAEVNDQDATMLEYEAEAILLAAIPREIWREVLRQEKRHELMVIADQGNASAVHDWLIALCD